MKKIMATLLALVLVLAMCVPAMAATSSLTINNAYVGTRFKAYQMLELEVSADYSSYNFTIVPAWNDFLGAYIVTDRPDDNAVPVIYNGENVFLNVNASNVAAFATAAEAYAKEKGIATTLEAEAANNAATFENLPYGYYLVLTLNADGSINDAKTPLAITVDGRVDEIYEKNAYPQMDKVVRESDASIGDIVTFDIHLKMSAAGTKYVVHDKMEDGFTFRKIASVEYEGKMLTENVDYRLVMEPGDEKGCTFHIELTDPQDGWKEGGRLVITYLAELDKDAEIYTATNDNTAWLEFTDDNSDHNELTPVTTSTVTFQFSLVKTDNENKLLDGAEFKLEDSAGNVINVVAVDGGYRVAESTDEDTTVVIAVTGGNVMISGLGNDTYTLTETKAPIGYNMLQAPVTVTINGANNPATVLDGVWENGGLQVINQTGSELPSTGGIGTTIFYVVGGAMMLIAVVLLVAKKKVSGNK